MALTQKQEAFCLAYIETGNASEAYRRAYKPKKMTDKSVNEKASQFLAQVKIKSRLEELRAPVREKALLTLESHLARLDELSRKAEADDQYAAAITAETNRGKAAGLYTERIEHSGPNGTAPVFTVVFGETEDEGG
ncbi:terminase small subunit [Achromobacter ruhlandii]|uniref:terminase small subunit n=1 Tax=Achromobacter ruhlandii TaxID=72557 RepID=UPI0009EEDCE1|nr:terminase small subunit [Achromobacter ruhlandii]